MPEKTACPTTSMFDQMCGFSTLRTLEILRKHITINTATIASNNKQQQTTNTNKQHTTSNSDKKNYNNHTNNNNNNKNNHNDDWNNNNWHMFRSRIPMLDTSEIHPLASEKLKIWSSGVRKIRHQKSDPSGCEKIGNLILRLQKNGTSEKDQAVEASETW